jgi:putative ABC transport system substrate-binding protein
MRRRRFITLLGGAAAVWPVAAGAQQPAKKVYRIGMLEILSESANERNFAAFKQALAQLGYIEGQNLLIEYRSAQGHDERFRMLTNELLGLKVDLLITRGTPAVLAAKSATTTIPVVMASIADPLVAVASIAHPGGNVTGFSALLNEMQAKRVQLLKDAVPGIASIGFLGNLGNPAMTAAVRTEFETAARLLGLRPHYLDARKSEDLDRLFDEALGQHVDALLVTNDSVLQANRRLITGLAAKRRLPAIYLEREFIDAGGLMSYGTSFPDLYRQAASYADKIFKETKPADLPIQQPTKFELVVNLKTAQALGLTIPPMILARADEVIE